MIDVVVVDDHPIVREGIVAVLATTPEFHIVEAVGTAEDAIEIARRAAPDVVLLDLELPKMSGLEAIARIKAVSPRTRIIVFSAYASDDRVVRAVQNGAAGYVLKGGTREQIVSAIRTVHVGGAFFEGETMARVLAHVRRPKAASDLTPRENAVLQLLAEGASNRRIAEALGITERTAKFHVQAICNKLGAENRVQAVALASQRNLV